MVSHANREGQSDKGELGMSDASGGRSAHVEGPSSWSMEMGFGIPIGDRAGRGRSQNDGRKAHTVMSASTYVHTPRSSSDSGKLHDGWCNEMYTNGDHRIGTYGPRNVVLVIIGLMDPPRAQWSASPLHQSPVHTAESLLCNASRLYVASLVAPKVPSMYSLWRILSSNLITYVDLVTPRDLT